jgi:glycosyltransferase involved in cell wall biosynthesis
VGNTGFVVPPGKPEALAKGVMNLHSLGADERRRLGELARKRIQNQYSLEKMIEEFRAVWVDAASGNKAGNPKQQCREKT